MKSGPFREDAADSFISSEELDRASRQIRGKSSFILWLTFILVVTAIILAWIIEVPVKVKGHGVIWSPEGVRQIAASAPGRVLAIEVNVGDRVAAGDLIASLDQTELRAQLASSSAQLKALQSNLAGLKRLQETDRNTREQLALKRDALFTQSNERAEQQVQRLRERLEALASLEANGLIEADRVAALETQLSQIIEQTSNLQRQLLSEERQEHAAEISLERELLQKDLEVARLEAEIVLLQSQLRNNGALTTPIAGSVVEVSAAVGDYLSPGAPVLLIQPDVGDASLSAIVFVPSQQTKPIRPGMKVELALPSFPSEMYGTLQGTVAELSPLPLSTTALMRELRNDQLVQTISEGGSPFLVRVELRRQSDASGAYLWSSPSDRPRELFAGMTLEGSVVTSKTRLLNLFLPKVR